MDRFFEKVVKHRKRILILFLVVTGICYFAWQQVSVNYDMNDYLPETAESTISLDKMQEEFTGEIPNARVMIENVTIPEALEYKNKIAEVDGVTEVLWLDDSIDITEPLSTVDTDTIETYYKDNNALFKVSIEKAKRISAVNEIEDIVGNSGSLTGSAVSTAVATQNTVKEVQKMTIIAIIFVTIVLFLTTTSWFEPIIVLIGLGVAILINNGTNLIFGEISFVTNAAGSILQLAVSLDYSVFLIHRFEECRQEEKDASKAMVSALSKSCTSILSSGLTTVIGFFALILMQFRIGPDLGLALAKGTAVSLITVFLFTPSIVLLTYKWLEKTRHKQLYPSFKKLGVCVSKISKIMVVLFVLVLVPAYLAANANSYYYGSSHIFGNQTKLGQDTEKIEDIFGKSDTYVVIVPSGSSATEVKLSNEIKALDEVSDVISFVDNAGAEIPYSYLDTETLEKLESGEYSRLVISVNVAYEGTETFEVVEKIRNIENKYYPEENYLAGEGVSTYDLMDTVTKDMVKVNILAIGAVFIVLLATMKNFIVPIILVIAIEGAIYINLAIPYFMGTSIFYIAYLIISSIQLGATVDYAILMTDRYKENRIYLTKKKAIIQTISDTTVSIMTSGSVLAVVGLLLNYMSTNGLLAQLGLFIGRGAILSVIIVLFVLPGLLYLFDKYVVKETRGNK